MNHYWIEWEAETPASEETMQLIETVLDAGLENEGIDTDVEISVTITTAEEVHRINREFRGIDRTTDVLSFPMVEYPSVDMDPETRRQAVEASEWNPDTEAVLLGDIIINDQQAQLQAEEYGHSLQREIAFLTIHSLLHLLGYDHMEEDQEQQMREHQNQVLEKLHITR